ncbi:hypothetical protein NSZ01_03190 [Nocardioides szechwanensis]|uniref:Uncharacterized protein n=1 Tax=Nocardioides szechwanensis TaxID=1005944 RepID=A0A1G9WS15_9ACTN|nr:hypothetical protein [Nocardioides szechwanensis]GEP32551.1 hypothetical protein NSZ01_03190 [Nocardioides szechwanensis]SDM86973.1 hypothetical protein SAMN05192576_1136 [Nocardioides szechwanensis]
MITFIAIVCVVAVAWPIACGASSPASGRSRNRDAGRRTRYVEAHPQHANSGDVERRLLAADLTPAEARLVVEKAAAHGIKPFTMWMWIDQYDAKTLAVVVTADLGHHELLAHLGAGTLPDLEHLRLFASINGLPLTERKLKTPVTATVVLTGGQYAAHKETQAAARAATQAAETQQPVAPPMPPIFEPGSWPYTEWAAGELPQPPRTDGPEPEAGSGGIIAA